MKMIAFNTWLFVCLFCLQSCKKDDLFFESGDIAIEIKAGEHWIHDFPLFLGLTKKNPPQFAIWIEDTSGNYLSTVFVTNKIATEGWQSNDGNRRKESLPHWCYQRGVIYSDGLLLPTKEEPLTDGITSATPKTDKTIKFTPKDINMPFVVKAEFNHSVDYNEFYTEDEPTGSEFYSGGKGGSGQPAVVYMATIYPSIQSAVLELVGHSSPDGTNGLVYPGLDKLTSAKSIVKSINLSIR